MTSWDRSVFCRIEVPQSKLKTAGESGKFSVPEIGDMDERVVEGGEDTGDAEDELTWMFVRGLSISEREDWRIGDWFWKEGSYLLGLEGPGRCSRWRRARLSS